MGRECLPLVVGECDLPMGGVLTSRGGECDLPLRGTPYGVLTLVVGECYLLLGRECLPLLVGVTCPWGGSAYL